MSKLSLVIRLAVLVAVLAVASTAPSMAEGWEIDPAGVTLAAR